jgi:2,4-dienoyl-CoA reductase [(3E)-enoyl-CoA-producing], peroxisomal
VTESRHADPAASPATGQTGKSDPAPSPTSVFQPGMLAGQVALITGGGSGIGFGISQLIAALGAHVVLASRKRDILEAAATRLREAGGQATVAPLDVRDPESVQRVVTQVTQDLGRIDLLVNNAGGNFYAPSATLSPNAWRSVIEIDLSGTFFCSQAVAAVMRAQGGGRIVSISMTLHYRGWPQMAHATAAKAGIDALTRTLAVEWAPWGIRVNAVAPGPIPTEGVRRAFAPQRVASSRTHGGTSPADPGAATETGPADVFALESALTDYARRAIPLGRWGTPRDIANMVAFLASSAGDWITGAILVVDGGEWLQRQQPV